MTALPLQGTTMRGFRVLWLLIIGLTEWYDDLDCEGYEEDFWIVMENIAVRKGMQYYEDLSDEEYKKACEEWRDIE